MQSRSNGVRTAAANLTSLERERRSKSAAPGRRAPARGEERSLFLLLVGSRKKEKAAADAKQGNGVTGPREQSTTIQCGSFGIAVEGCRTGPDAARAGLLLTHPAVVHSARRAPSTPPPFWPEEALFQSMVWALGRSERSAFDVGHGQGMLDAEEAGLLPSPRERGQQHFPLFGS
eukprot:tig00001027_g6370.t2